MKGIAEAAAPPLVVEKLQQSTLNRQFKLEKVFFLFIYAVVFVGGIFSKKVSLVSVYVCFYCLTYVLRVLFVKESFTCKYSGQIVPQLSVDVITILYQLSTST